MVRLIQKSGYIKAGSASGYMKYIATRERVEKLEGSGPVTKGQRQLIENLLRDFPDATELEECNDYRSVPTTGNASSLISAVLDINAHRLTDRDGYMRYIATRPRVERHGEHGLFSSRPASLNAALREVEQHSGNVWTFIWSLRREDAARLGYDNADRWRKLLSNHAMDMAKAMRIPYRQFRWYAAFHDEGHHPHVHMVCYSADGKSGFLTKQGIADIKSMLAKEIFQQDLIAIYQKQTQRRDELTKDAGEVMRQLVSEMQSGALDNQRIEQLLVELAKRLQNCSGKKQYGYLPPAVKSLVDEIVGELAKDPRIAAAYDLWYEQREEVLRTYKDDLPERIPLSQQKEFKRIKNIIIEEATHLGEMEQTAESAQADEAEQAAESASADDDTPSYQQPTTLPVQAKAKAPTAGQVFNATSSLLYHMARIFQEQRPQPAAGMRLAVDSKLKRKIREKKIAMGHRPDDHEEEQRMQ